MHYQCGCVRADDNSTRLSKLCSIHAAACREAVSAAVLREREECALISEDTFGKEFGPDAGGVIARRIREKAKL